MFIVPLVVIGEPVIDKASPLSVTATDVTVPVAPLDFSQLVPLYITQSPTAKVKGPEPKSTVPATLQMYKSPISPTPLVKKGVFVAAFHVPK